MTDSEMAVSPNCQECQVPALAAKALLLCSTDTWRGRGGGGGTDTSREGGDGFRGVVFLSNVIAGSVLSLVF